MTTDEFAKYCLMALLESMRYRDTIISEASLREVLGKKLMMTYNGERGYYTLWLEDEE